jgi:adenylate cyclase
MAEERVQRRLAAILSADVVGYSRLMGIDEAGTLARLKELRRELIDPTIASHSGRIVKLMGDGMLVEFGSAVDAVACAIEIQKHVPGHDSGNAEARPMQFRIGINVGDIIIEGDDIFGDGVNIAARLEPLAEPGGICVSSIVNESVGNRIDVEFSDSGDISVKNIDRPIRVWKWHPGKTDVAANRSDAANPTPKVETPSIAVLPFTNMSGDPEQEYFSDGISEDVITDLSKIAGLMVISRNSSFTYKGRSVDVRAVGRDLGVRSVLEGSVRRAANRVRITAQLIDATNGAHLWADRYDRDLTDIFAVQDDVTRRIVEALKVTLSPAEKERHADSGTSNIDAYDCFLRGRELLFGKTNTREMFEQSTKYLMRALELDPNYSKAHAGLSMAYSLDYQNRWSDDPDTSLRLSKQNAEQAIRKDPAEPFARLVASWAAIFEKDLDRAKSEADVALSLNPNFALAYTCLAQIQTLSGRPLEAIPALERGIRLDPAYRQQNLHMLGMAYLLAGKYETAAAVLRERVLLVPETDFSRALLVSALGHLGEVDEARRIWQELKEINPKYSFSEHFARRPFKREEDVQRIAEGLLKAGLSIEMDGWPTPATPDAPEC